MFFEFCLFVCCCTGHSIPTVVLVKGEDAPDPKKRKNRAYRGKKENFNSGRPVVKPNANEDSNANANADAHANTNANADANANANANANDNEEPLGVEPELVAELDTEAVPLPVAAN